EQSVGGSAPLSAPLRGAPLRPPVEGLRPVPRSGSPSPAFGLRFPRQGPGTPVSVAALHPAPAFPAPSAPSLTLRRPSAVGLASRSVTRPAGRYRFRPTAHETPRSAR